MSRFQYRVYFRFLETRDEYFHHGAGLGRWRIYGIHLPDDVLKKVYYKNATKLLGLDK
jgi:predicted TIM-barrel fold metal-dependent hydrolase